MKQFEDKLQASAQRLARQDDRNLHVPQNPMQQKRAYWGWVATPAAAVVGLVFGMSLHLFTGNHPDTTLAQSIDTIRIFQPVHDTYTAAIPGHKSGTKSHVLIRFLFPFC